MVVHHCAIGNFDHHGHLEFTKKKGFGQSVANERRFSMVINYIHHSIFFQVVERNSCFSKSK